MKKSQKKGVALIWAVIFSSILILISSTMVSYIIKESQSSVRIAESSRAYSFAKSGITWSSFQIEQIKEANESANYSGAGLIFEFDFDADGTKETSVTIKSSGNDFNIISTSNNNGIVRTLELNTSESPPKSIQNLGSINIPLAPELDPDNTESFEINFNFWAKDATIQHLKIGASSMDRFESQSSGNYLYASLENIVATGNVMKLSAKINAETPTITEDLPLNETWQNEDDAKKTQLGNYTGTLRYIKDTSASFRIMRNESGNKKTCIKAISLDLVGKDLGNLNYLFLQTTGGGLTDYKYYPRSDLATPADLADPDRIKWNYLHSKHLDGVHLDGLTFKKY